MEHAEESATALAHLTRVARHDVAVVLGSGWIPAAERIGETIGDFPVTDLPEGTTGGTRRRISEILQGLPPPATW